jgi:hypothetical protein
MTEKHNDSLLHTILANSDGRVIQAVLENKVDGSVIEVSGVNRYTDKVPHLQKEDGSVFPYAYFSIRSFR